MVCKHFLIYKQLIIIYILYILEVLTEEYRFMTDISINGDNLRYDNNPDKKKADETQKTQQNFNMNEALKTRFKYGDDVFQIPDKSNDIAFDRTNNRLFPADLKLPESKPKEKTPEQKQAVAELNEKTSSTGIKYKDAQETIKKLREKYSDDKYFFKYSHNPNTELYKANFSFVKELEDSPQEIEIKQFMPDSIPEPDRTAYKEAVEAAKEIEGNNAALIDAAGMTGEGHVYDSDFNFDISEMRTKLGEDELTPVPTPEQEAKKAEAKAKLDDKESSTGIKYKDAAKTIADIEAQYNSDEYFEEEVIDDKMKKLSEFIGNPIKPRKHFAPDKLPEPARTQYKEAKAAKTEIEQNNRALAQQAGIKVADRDAAGTSKPSRFEEISDIALLGTKPKEPTEKELEARNKLNEKTSSNGIKYADAKETLKKLKEKYKNDPNCRSKFDDNTEMNKLPAGGSTAAYYPPYEAFDAYKIPEPDKTEYFKALKAAQEIESTNSALFMQTGLALTPTPEKSTYDDGIRFYRV